MKKYEWNEKSISNYYFETKTGKIVASLFRSNFSDDVWHAEVNGDNLGQYISEKCAKVAVESKIKEIDHQYEELRKKVPKTVA